MRARSLRADQTHAEAKLWSRLRNRQILDLKFRRQHPTEGYFADFACVEIGLVVEIDGGQHNEPGALQYDGRRAAAMAKAGFQPLRFWTHDVLAQTDTVIQAILNAAETLTPALSQRERVRSAGERIGMTLTPALAQREREQDTSPSRT